MTPAQTTMWLLLGVALLISVVTDVLQRRILDAVTHPAIAAGLVLRFGAEGPGTFSTGFLSGALGALALGGLFGVMAWRGKMGWGDAKLAAAVGACAGLETSLAAAVFISLTGAVQALITLAWHGAVVETAGAALARWAARLRLAPAPEHETARRHIPYGVAIALGTLWTFWWRNPNL